MDSVEEAQPRLRRSILASGGLITGKGSVACAGVFDKDETSWSDGFLS